MSLDIIRFDISTRRVVDHEKAGAVQHTDNVRVKNHNSSIHLCSLKPYSFHTMEIKSIKFSATKFHQIPGIDSHYREIRHVSIL